MEKYRRIPIEFTKQPRPTERPAPKPVPKPLPKEQSWEIRRTMIRNPKTGK